MLAAMAAGCSAPAGSPDFTGADASVSTAPSGPTGPSVDEKLSAEASQQRIIYHVGPVDLPAQTQAAMDQPLSMRFQVDAPIWATGFVPKVVDANGSELPGALLHHALILNMHEDNPLCSEAGGGDPIFAATSLLSEIDLPAGVGYPILTTDPLEARVILQNPTDTSYTGVSFELTVVARPMNEFANLSDVKPMFVETDPCGHAPLDVEPGAFAERTASYQVLGASTLLVASAVITDYGAAVELTAGKETTPFWRAEAELDDTHHIVSLADNPFADPKGLALKAGEALTLNVSYDNTSQEWLHGAVGGAMVYLAVQE